MKSRSDAPPCGACGRPVVGHVPSPGGEGTPCCSLECARRIARRGSVAHVPVIGDLTPDKWRVIESATRQVWRALGPTPELTADAVMAAPLMTCAKCGEQEIGIARSPSRASAPIPWGWRWIGNSDAVVCDRCAREEEEPELMTAEAERFRRELRELQARHRTAIGLLTDAERSLEAIRAFLTSENAL